ncbi:MAG: hypothetical protein CYPHOPRED_001846 [Cyphobasidiales sp. Tagirdzhanova-0007]|nr:MAG: hypothetical protein CYPHOPRED_001846 [Cyphobasidiales sp. Tagirdzhanova-0007]
MTGCVSSTVVGFLLPMCMILSFFVGCTLVHRLGTARRRKTKAAHADLLREKDAFKDKEIQTHQSAVQRYAEEATKWRKEAEMNKAASDSYKRMLEAHGVPFQRQTMLYNPSDVEYGGRDSQDNYERLRK